MYCSQTRPMLIAIATVVSVSLRMNVDFLVCAVSWRKTAGTTDHSNPSRVCAYVNGLRSTITCLNLTMKVRVAASGEHDWTCAIATPAPRARCRSAPGLFRASPETLRPGPSSTSARPRPHSESGPRRRTRPSQQDTRLRGKHTRAVDSSARGPALRLVGSGGDSVRRPDVAATACRVWRRLGPAAWCGCDGLLGLAAAATTAAA
ncbi:hypothetical protein T492DRAFT_1022439 [Pavlovales sp. CCMP2436]|nr:hypothetical protein T492DRAFT_1022439 [Pavlovales sp. CCMP2436]